MPLPNWLSTRRRSVHSGWTDNRLDRTKGARSVFLRYNSNFRQTLPMPVVHGWSQCVAERWIYQLHFSCWPVASSQSRAVRFSPTIQRVNRSNKLYGKTCLFWRTLSLPRLLRSCLPGRLYSGRSCCSGARAVNPNHSFKPPLCGAA